MLVTVGLTVVCEVLDGEVDALVALRLNVLLGCVIVVTLDPGIKEDVGVSIAQRSLSQKYPKGQHVPLPHKGRAVVNLTVHNSDCVCRVGSCFFKSQLMGWIVEQFCPEGQHKAVEASSKEMQYVSAWQQKSFGRLGSILTQALGRFVGQLMLLDMLACTVEGRSFL